MNIITKQFKDLDLKYDLSHIAPLEDILFIDIETTGLSPRNSEIYLIGTGFYQDGRWMISQFFAENTTQEEEVLSAFSDFSRSFKYLVHFTILH